MMCRCVLVSTIVTYNNAIQVVERRFTRRDGAYEWEWENWWSEWFDLIDRVQDPEIQRCSSYRALKHTQRRRQCPKDTCAIADAAHPAKTCITPCKITPMQDHKKGTQRRHASQCNSTSPAKFSGFSGGW